MGRNLLLDPTEIYIQKNIEGLTVAQIAKKQKATSPAIKYQLKKMERVLKTIGCQPKRTLCPDCGGEMRDVSSDEVIYQCPHCNAVGGDNEN